jgi:hypothetical protein
MPCKLWMIYSWAGGTPACTDHCPMLSQHKTAGFCLIYFTMSFAAFAQLLELKRSASQYILEYAPYIISQPRGASCINRKKYVYFDRKRLKPS